MPTDAARLDQCIAEIRRLKDHVKRCETVLRYVEKGPSLYVRNWVKRVRARAVMALAAGEKTYHDE